MQELKLANDLFWGVFDGSKKATIRLGKRDITLGTLAFEAATDGGWGIIVKVTKVTHKKLSELTDEESRLDGASNAAEMAEAMKAFYPNITTDSDITIIEFDYTDPFSPPQDVLDAITQDVLEELKNSSDEV